MSELIQNDKSKSYWQLLATVSAIALLGYAPGASARSDEPQVWIELGGQLTRLDIGQEPYSPGIMANRPAMFAPSAIYQELPHQSVDETGELSFQPKGSDWTFSVGVQYGRSVRHVDVNQQTFPAPFDATFYFQGHKTSLGYHAPLAARFASTIMKSSESHLLLDFQVGKDVGLGIFGRGTSQINLGVRFAQFNSKSNVTLRSDPDWHQTFKYTTVPFLGLYHFKVWNGEGYHSYSANLQAERSFRGIGPSLSWNGSSPFLGGNEDGGLALDYGANVAVLFGRQRATVAHQTTGISHAPVRYAPRLQTTALSTVHPRSRSVVVPNVGAFAGVTYRIHDFKMSAGYRADFFFNAMDSGNDARRTEKIGNYGPFATVSFGLGG